MNIKKKITFITPCFCHGADGKTPEIRAASIRGQLHWWFRALGGSREDEKRSQEDEKRLQKDENEIFGSVHGDAKASKIVVRVKPDEHVRVIRSPILPHKSGMQRDAIAPGVSFELQISSRLGGLDDRLEKAFLRCLDAWLLMGSLGLRATRGGGNFRFEQIPGDTGVDGDGVLAESPESAEEYQKWLKEIFGEAKDYKVALSEQSFKSAEDARKILAQTGKSNFFDCCNNPLGNFSPRKTSPLRFRIVKFSSQDYRIAVGLDERFNSLQEVESAMKILSEENNRRSQGPKPIAAIIDSFLKQQTNKPADSK